ncbi:MAG: ABC transporter substrate-binding protein, partial [Chloroflexota bacterium]|nr:ABC transporter substrate-binding protein [Chloroflexota bacterium]
GDIIQVGMNNLKTLLAIPGAWAKTKPALTRSGAQVALAGQYYMAVNDTGKPTGRVPLTNLPWVGDPADPASMAKARKVRWAMAISIDRQKIVDSILGGKGDPHYWWNMGPGHPRWTPEMEKYAIPYNPTEAKKLLAEAGYPKGFDFEFWIPTGLDPVLGEMCQALIPMFQAVGLNPKVDNAAYTAVRPKLLARTIDKAWCWGEAGWDTDIWGLYRFHTRAVWNNGIEYAQALEMEKKILGSPTVDEAYKVIAQEWIPWLYETVPMFQTVSYPPMWGVGPRVTDWPISFMSGLQNAYPRQTWRITLKD